VLRSEAQIRVPTPENTWKLSTCVFQVRHPYLPTTVFIFNDCVDQDASWCGNRPRPRPHYIRWGPASIPQKGQIITQFWAHVYCGQTAGWIKMILGTEVGIGPGDIVLDGDPSPPPPKRGGTAAPIFWPMSIVAKLSSISATAELFF